MAKDSTRHSHADYANGMRDHEKLRAYAAMVTPSTSPAPNYKARRANLAQFRADRTAERRRAETIAAFRAMPNDRAPTAARFLTAPLPDRVSRDIAAPTTVRELAPTYETIERITTMDAIEAHKMREVEDSQRLFAKAALAKWLSRYAMFSDRA